MKKHRDLQRELETLDEKYTRLFGEKSELEYKLKLMQSEADHNLEQSEEIRSLHEGTRRLKHDMKNHLMVIASYLNGGNYTQAKAYISEILDKLAAVNSYVETGNLLLNHIINRYFELARSRYILIKAEIESLSFSKVEALDFSAILSNMLDNAIEACKNEKVPEIQVIVSKKRVYQAVLVKNRISNSILETNPYLRSTKPEKEQHGIGVPQIKSLTEKYGGLFDFYEEDSFFCVCVMLPE